MSERLRTGTPVVLDDRELTTLLDFAGRLADASNAVILPYFRADLDIHDKAQGAGYDPVTVADHAAEEAIRELIGRTYPDHGVYGEEHGFEPGTAGLTWVIDPIDGTRAFITGLPLWGTLIALYDGEKPVAGIMDQPYLQERFVGSRLGVQMRTPRGVTTLRTRPCRALSAAVLQTTHPGMFTTAQERAAFAEVDRRVRLTRFSGDCYGYCMLAHGLIDLVIEAGLAPYDVQALIPIVEAAGGVITSWSGRSAAFGGQIVAAGDARLHEQALGLLAGAATDRP